MTEIGKINRLKIVKEVDFGVYLDGEELDEILLPQKYTPQECKINDWIEVFIYLDSEDRLIATTLKPLAMVGECAFLKVVSIEAVGAFLDWGLVKDLLVPFSQQKQKMIKGRSYIVFVYLDEQTRRIAASAKLDKFIDKQPPDYYSGQKVDLFIVNETDIGYNTVINNTHRGLLYKSEVFQQLKSGQKINGYIQKVRDDKKIDLSLYKPGHEKVDELAENILNQLKKQDGFIAITDKTAPGIIYQLFGVSKKTFKKAIGSLFKQKLITIEQDGIRHNPVPLEE